MAAGFDHFAQIDRYGHYRRRGCEYARCHCKERNLCECS
jgi:hypothetical protein